MASESDLDKALRHLREDSTIKIFGDIDDRISDLLVKLFEEVIILKLSRIRLLIDSKGGDAVAGIRIYNSLLLLRSSGVFIEGLVVSRASSAASIILQACSIRILMPCSYILIHWGRSSVSNLDQDALYKDDSHWFLYQTKTSNEEMLNLYLLRALVPKEDLLPLCTHEVRVFSELAISYGLADAVYKVEPPSLSL